MSLLHFCQSSCLSSEVKILNWVQLSSSVHSLHLPLPFLLFLPLYLYSPHSISLTTSILYLSIFFPYPLFLSLLVPLPLFLPLPVPLPISELPMLPILS